MITNIKRKRSDGLRYFEKDGAIYWELYFKCPICVERNYQNVPTTYWWHGSCKPSNGNSNKIFLGDNGKFICEYCEKSDVMILWGYNCPIHEPENNDKTRYIRCTNVKVLSKVIGIAAMMVENAGEDWLIKVLLKIRDQFRDPKYNKKSPI